MSIYVSVYIFALACFHLDSLVLVDTTCVGSGQIRSDQVRSGQILWSTFQKPIYE